MNSLRRFWMWRWMATMRLTIYGIDASAGTEIVLTFRGRSQSPRHNPTGKFCCFSIFFSFFFYQTYFICIDFCWQTLLSEGCCFRIGIPHIDIMRILLKLFRNHLAFYCPFILGACPTTWGKKTVSALNSTFFRCYCTMVPWGQKLLLFHFIVLPSPCFRFHCSKFVVYLLLGHMGTLGFHKQFQWGQGSFVGLSKMIGHLVLLKKKKKKKEVLRSV